MPRFVISPHFRLQEWVAEEKGYFAGEGLDYEFREAIGTKDAKRQNLGDRVGAYQTIERGRQCDVSAACHWTINTRLRSFRLQLDLEDLVGAVHPRGLRVGEEIGRAHV